MPNLQSRNGEIELLRLIFCISVVFHHLSSHFNLNAFYRGSFGVEFFFIVSGFFMAKSAEKIIDDNYTANTLQFIKKKIITFLPYYLGAVLINFIVLKIFIEQTNIEYIIVHSIKLIPELMFLQMGGFTTESQLNIPAVWYLSSMLLAMLVLFPLAIKFKKSYGIIFLIISIFGLGYIVKEYGAVVAFRTTDIGLCYHGMLRGLCEVALGAACYQICKTMSACHSPKRKILLTILKYLGYIFVCVFSFSNFKSTYEPIALIILTICLILTNSTSTYNVPYNKFIGFCGKLSLPLYLFHSIVFRCITALYGNQNKSVSFLSITLIVVFISSILFMFIIDIIMKMIHNNKDTNKIKV